MTGTSSRNTFGIFKTKKAKCLAIKYKLDLNNPNAYIHNGPYITLYDVQFIVDNLWLDHFMYTTDPPLELSANEYNDIYYNIQYKCPDIFDRTYA